ncbi:hypothetical protein DRJ53_10995 [Paracnuella aquatica]|nr:hypothetical protein DRJ53_10995 [Paracnuella aquatica]
MMMRYSMLMLLALTACGQNNTATTPTKQSNATLVRPASQQEATAKIRNNIEVQASGVTLEQAYLTYDDGTLVSEDNVTNVNKKLVLNLVVDGWQVQDGKVHLEASEKLATSEGEVLLDEPALFSKSGLQALSPQDARYLRLNIVVTGINELSDYYEVTFKVWNTYTQQFIYGTYRFFIG